MAHRSRRKLTRSGILLFFMLVPTLFGGWHSRATTQHSTPSPAHNTVTHLNQLAWDLIGGPPDPRFGAVESWRQPPAAADLKIRWERLTFLWSAFQPDNGQEWNGFADNFDKEYDQELKDGRSLVGLLIRTPKWAASNPASPSNSPPQGLNLPWNDPGNYWGAFVYRIVKHFTGKINYWCIWNEVDIPTGTFHTWDGSRAQYAQLVRVAYQATKAANPAAKIVLYGEPYWYDKGSYFHSVLGYLTSMPDAKANNYFFDIANLHLYSRPKDMAQVVNWIRGEIAQRGIPPKPVWISETNSVPRDDAKVNRIYPKANFNSTMDDQASFIIEAVAVDLAVGVQRIEVNRLYDGPDFTNGGEPFGMVRNDGSVRPLYYAYKTATSLFSGVTAGKYLPNRATGVYQVILRRPGYQITVAWNQHALPAAVDIPAITPSAYLITKVGAVSTTTTKSGVYHLALDPATDNSNAGDPTDFVVGGNPIVLVQAVTK